MSGDGSGVSTIEAVELDDADRARIDYLSHDDAGLSEEEAERVVRFAKVDPANRSPNMLHITTGDEPPVDSNGPTSPDTASEPSATDYPCGELRRRMREADRPTDVIDAYPDSHPSAIFRHAEGRCTCDADEPPTTSPRVSQAECMDMRRTFRAGATKRDVMADFHRSANAVNKHLFGRCSHGRGGGNPVDESLSVAECAHLRDAYRRNGSLPVADLAAAYRISSSTAHKHLRGKCAHAVDVDPIPPVEITDETCGGMRRDYKRDPRAVVARIARNHDTSRSTADYHIFGRCECDADEPPAKRR